MSGVRAAWRAAAVAGVAAAALTVTALSPLGGQVHAAARTESESQAVAGSTPAASAGADPSTTVRARSASVGRLAAPLSAPARPDSGGYRYWSFWKQGDEPGTWAYATQGPSVLRPGDGDVLGFRFALSADSEDAAQPRARTRFSRVCDGTAPKSGHKRVALSIDFGTSAHAPRGESPPKPREACARVADDATAADALAAVAQPLRYDSAALLCAIDGYPKRGCGEKVTGDGEGGDAGKGEDDGRAEAADRAEGSDGGPDGGGTLGPVAGTAAGLGAVALLAFAAVRRTRRDRSGRRT